MTDGAVRSLIAALALVAAWGCGENVTTRASDTDEARLKLEAGGWWPSGIPAAATAILETHDLDTNVQKIVFSVERESCRQTAAALGSSSTNTVAAVPALPLDGWPAWLSSDVIIDAVRERGTVAALASGGKLLLMCEDGKGYFWRSGGR